MNIEYVPFRSLDLGDIFFDSLKLDYSEFESWFEKKSNRGDSAYVIRNNVGTLEAFLYLKEESDAVTDIVPSLPAQNRIKVGTFKINPHGTKLGERFLKRIFDHATVAGIDEMYVTIFPKHRGLYDLLTRFGFEKVAEKTTSNGTEDVLLKRISKRHNNPLLDYPKVLGRGHQKFILSIQPQFHTRLFPDSILNNETFDILSDVSHTNSIFKVYIGFMDKMAGINSGDILVIYRTTDQPGRAWYRSVVTSICTVLEVKTRRDFTSITEYLDYCEPYSVFNRNELSEWYNRTGNLFVLKMLYNAALSRRLIRKTLIEDIGLDGGDYWGVLNLTDAQFQQIASLGGVNANLIVN